MPDNIDYEFLSAREGGCKTIGYVPAAQVSKSGVTIATGFDLGPRSEAELNNLGLPILLIAKLKPYLGKKSQDAVDYLRTNPLRITLEEGKSIDKAVRSSHINSLKIKYFASIHNTEKKDFFNLPTEAQTVIASVSFQYGFNLDTATPKFWKAVASQDWKEAVKVLEGFNDHYPSRRRMEAALLGKIVK